MLKDDKKKIKKIKLRKIKITNMRKDLGKK